MMRSVLNCAFGIGRKAQCGRPRMSSCRRLLATVEGLETRSLMTVGTIVQSPGQVVVTPASTGPDTTIVTYQLVKGAMELDVQLNGTNNYFSLSQVGIIYYKGSGASGAQTFDNTTGVFTEAWGGSGANLFEGGTGEDEFIGGSGSNTFDAGSGFDVLIGGTGANVFNENLDGSGIVSEFGAQNTVNVPTGSTGSYQVYF